MNLKMTCRKSVGKYVAWSTAILVWLLAVFGCTTKPNLSIVGDNYVSPRGSETDENFLAAKAILSKISSQNELLAIELGKLPELLDGVSVDEKKALENLLHVYRDNPQAFDTAFEEIYQVGLPDVRKYCTPLQALFWLAEDGRLSTENNLLVDYSLERLLIEAWETDQSHSRLMSDEQILEVINDTQIESDKELFINEWKSGDFASLQSHFIRNYEIEPYRNKKMFSKKAHKIIKQNLISRIDSRWGNYGVVIDRLNAPELVDFYEKQRFSYVYWWELPTPEVNPRYVFKYNKGECVSITRFTVLCLSRAGYKAHEYRGKSPTGEFPFHAVCVFEVDGKKYVMDNGRISPKGISLWDAYRYK